MKYSFMGGDCPQYVDPTFEEICELAATRWDSIRILANDADDRMILASGYGNTHTTLATRARLIGWRLGWSPCAYIIYHEQGQAYFNLADVTGHEREPAAQAVRELFTPAQQVIIRDLLRESGY